MAKPIEWTTAQDHKIRAMRGADHSWDAIASALGVCRWTTIVRGRSIGAVAPARVCDDDCDPEREALPAGSGVTWGAINPPGSSLHGSPYPLPTYDQPSRRERVATRAAA